MMGELEHAIEVSAPLGGALAAPEWIAPVQLVFHCAPPRIQARIIERLVAGHAPKDDAKVYRRGDRFRALVEFEVDPALLIPLDVWTLEPRP